MVLYLNVGEGGKLHDSASKGPKGVLHVQGESEALAEQELAGENVFGMFFTECLGKPGWRNSSSSAAYLNLVRYGGTDSAAFTNVPSALHPKNNATINISCGGYVMMLFVT